MRGPHTAESKKKMSDAVKRAYLEGRIKLTHKPWTYAHREDCACMRCSPTGERSAKHRETSRKNLAKMDPAKRSAGGRRGALSRVRLEREAAVELVAEGFEVFAPYAVCDRIAVKDGRVYLVDFKKAGQKLRPTQQLVHDLNPSGYLIRIYVGA